MNSNRAGRTSSNKRRAAPVRLAGARRSVYAAPNTTQTRKIKNEGLEDYKSYMQDRVTKEKPNTLKRETIKFNFSNNIYFN